MDMPKAFTFAIGSVLLLSVGLVEIYAEESGEPTNCSTAKKLNRPEGLMMVSFGVLNGKAINLVKPEFPPAAHAINVRGVVVVSIIVDPTGCVAEAGALSGHPLLISASVRAALK